MGQTFTLTATDGHSLGAYRAEASGGAARGGLVVLQEIFGVNPHLREVCDGFAADGFTCIAPSLYDRSSRRNCQLGYGTDDVATGRRLREEFLWDDTVKDVAAAAAVLAGEGLAVGTVGYCWGGTISFLAATRLDVSAAVIYYGGQIVPYKDEKARCPMLMHFGEHDEGDSALRRRADRGRAPGGLRPRLRRGPRLQLRPPRKLPRSLREAREGGAPSTSSTPISGERIRPGDPGIGPTRHSRNQIPIGGRIFVVLSKTSRARGQCRAVRGGTTP